jgi:pimeloyl-ACP methyl ester carboxylesterase
MMGNECVILLHGLARSDASMKKMEKYCIKNGYTVFNIGYPSTEKPINELTTLIASNLKTLNAAAFEKMHFITHSMGGIITRNYVSRFRPSNLGNVVMLSPPNKGSELVDKLKGWKLFRMINGPAGQELGTGKTDIPSLLGKSEFSLGVITGTKSYNPLYSYLIPGDDDGKVSVESAKGAGYKDFLSVPCSHTFIMNNKKVIKETLFFIKNGRFTHIE